MERMVTIALDAQSKTPALASLPSSFHEALDSVGPFTCSKLTEGLNLHSAGPTVTNFPWDRRIIEESQRSVNALRDSVSCSETSLIYFQTSVHMCNIIIPRMYDATLALVGSEYQINTSNIISCGEAG